MSFCIPKKLAERLREGARRGEINMVELYDMTSEQRRNFFEFYTDETTAQGINAGLEKAMVSDHKKALDNWAKRTFSASEKKTPRAKNILDKIKDLSDKNLLNPDARQGFMQDLVSEKLGVTISEKEAVKINELSDVLQKEYAKGTDEFGLLQTGYWKARLEMDNYLAEINPAPKLRIATSTIGRAVMLASIKSPFLNVIGNTTQGLEQAFERRIENSRYSGKVDKKILQKYRKKVNEIFSESGYDVTRMQDLSDGRKTLGEDIVHSQGPGKVRFVGRIAENTIFKQMLGKPDVLFSSIAFADSANLTASRLAQEEGSKGDALTKRATELFLDGTSMSPTSINGRIIRSQAISDAMVATFTDDNNWSKASMAVRKALNDVTGDLKVGDQTMPFVKTPASVVAITIDVSGLSVIRGVRKLPQAIADMKSGDGTLMRSVARDFSRTGFGMIVAFIIASAFDAEDFIGAYPTSNKERELLKTKNARTNSLRFGGKNGKWISLEYFGFIASPLVGFLYAKKYANSFPEAMFFYATGASAKCKSYPLLIQLMM